MNSTKMIEIEYTRLCEPIKPESNSAEISRKRVELSFWGDREGSFLTLKSKTTGGYIVRLLTLTLVLFVFDTAIAGATTLELTNGDKLTGTIMQRTDQAIVLKHPVLGELIIPVTQITKASLAELDGEVSDQVELPPGETTAEESLQPVNETDTGELGLFANDTPTEWTKHVGAGLSGSGGNSDTLDATAAARAKLERPDKRWEFSSDYFYGKARGETNKNKLNAYLIRDWLWLESRWFISAQGRYEFDQFEDWDHRASLFAGPGYQFIKTQETSFLGRLGLGVTRTIGGENDEWTLELELGLDGSWQINEYSQFLAKATVFPSMTDQGEFRALTSLDWITKISQDGTLNLNLGLKNEYESDPSGDAARNDIDYYARIGYDF